MQIQESLQVGLNALSANALRSMLTILGIVFGVGAVIAMLGIGEGAQQDIMKQLALTGVNNIIIQNKKVDGNTEPNDSPKANFSRGLSLKDIESIRAVVPHVLNVAPETEGSFEAIYLLNHGTVNLVGTSPDYPVLFNYHINNGRFFSKNHMDDHAPVAVIGEDVKRKLFKTENPVGKKLKIGSVWLEVIGVVSPAVLSENKESEGDLGIRNPSLDVFIPVTTFMIRFDNPEAAGGNSDQENYNGRQTEKKITPQLSKVTIRVTDSQWLQPVRELLQRLLFRLHFKQDDFEILVPLELINQQQKTRQIFNIVLGAIGGISLLVGGIGIMNIMLASVTERTREIGIRRAIGATRTEIAGQFLIEALVLCLVGGVLGILFGFLIALLISLYTGISTIVTLLSIAISFSVAMITGLVFGYYPAKVAAEKDPVESLRYE